MSVFRQIGLQDSKGFVPIELLKGGDGEVNVD
jgi:hypothetical protein